MSVTGKETVLPMIVGLPAEIKVEPETGAGDWAVAARFSDEQPAVKLRPEV
jgi:hypothetical protein